MTLTQIHYVITIAETKSMNKAAELLYVAQPSLTNAIKELEKELGITLFFRSGKGVTLTNDGAEFLLHARQIYGEYENVMEKYGKTAIIKRNLVFRPSTIPLQSRPLWIWQKNLICPSMNLQSGRRGQLRSSVM